jgi:hypothetical protein
MDPLAAKAARQLADVIISNVGSVDEVIFGFPAEMKRELYVAGVPKCYVRVETEIREYLPVPISLWFLVMDEVMGAVRASASGAQSRGADEELESALIKVADGGELETRRLAKDNPQEYRGIYRTRSGHEHRVQVSWWSDNTMRLKAIAG